MLKEKILEKKFKRYEKKFNNYKRDIDKEIYRLYDIQFKYFYDYYKKESMENTEFSIEFEKSRLQFKLNNQYPSILGLYISGVISIILFMSSFFEGNGISITGIALIAVSLVLFSVASLMLFNNESDMWNVAFIALEAIEQENEEQKTIESFEKIQQSLKDIEELLVDIKKIKQFLDIK